MKKIKLIVFIVAVFACTFANAQTVERVMPDWVAGVPDHKLSLRGEWQFQYSLNSKWNRIQVPGEAAMQGYAIKHDKPMVYKKQIVIPANFQGQKTILRFDGVYSYARLFVNGVFVRDHFGGFTRWEADVTNLVKPGKKNEIRLDVTDRIDDISYASGYAHHPIGGILRDVTMYALPQTSLVNLAVETELDSSYRDAKLRIAYELDGKDNATVRYELKDPWGKVVVLPDAVKEVKAGAVNHSFQVSNPLKWDAEHPHLYTLTVSVEQAGKETYRFNRQIGFRKIEVQGNKLLVNGLPVKLRGACRHDIHPTLGRTTTAELDSLDVVLFKESNMNFVRTSHYPPSEAFLNFCDRYGVYVECETGVCFVNTYRQHNYAPGDTQDKPEYTPRYLSQCQEMVASHRSHSSVLFWSIGNESVYGLNFQRSYDWVKAADTTRPVIFSYPGSVKGEKKIYELLSMHYQDVYGNVDQWGMSTRNFQGHGIPAIFDEWAHPACYTYKTLQDDPNIREFWGQSLDMMWSGLFEAPGGLGGAIWGYVDETFSLPQPKVGTAFWKEFARTAKPEGFQGKCVGYGEWGIVDVWRRHKPEFWATKKAYSPIRLETKELGDVSAGEQILLAVYNRFDHTNLDELKVRYTYDGKKTELRMPAIAPHQKGVLVIPGQKWKNGTRLFVEFLSAEGAVIDAEMVALGVQDIPKIATFRENDKLFVAETAGQLIVKGNGFEVPFDKATGLITNAMSNGRVIIEKGPFLNLDINLNHLTGAEVRKSADKFYTHPADWKLSQMQYERIGDRMKVTITGTYKSVQVNMEIMISGNGCMDINYLTEGQPNGYLRETGLLFQLPQSVDKLAWNRKGYWSCYPEGAFAANEGVVSIYQSKQSAYAAQPTQPWTDDTHNYFYWADRGANCDKPLTRQAKGMKENVYVYTLSADTDQAKLSVVSSDASVACRISKTAEEQLMLYVNNRWDYPEIAWGNYCKTLQAVLCYGKISIIL